MTAKLLCHYVSFIAAGGGLVAILVADEGTMRRIARPAAARHQSAQAARGRAAGEPPAAPTPCR